MMKPHEYHALRDLLLERGRRLINSPDEYRHCHHLPRSYPLIAAHTPRSVWLEGTALTDIDEVMRLLAPFGHGPVPDPAVLFQALQAGLEPRPVP